MRRWLLLLVLLVPAAGEAQTFTGVELNIYSPGTLPPAAPLQTVVFPMTAAQCNLTPEAPEPPTLTNPRRFGFPDPANSSRQCVINVASLFLALPPATGYRVTLAFIYTTGTTNGTTERSPLSNPFRIGQVTPAAPLYVAAMR